MVNGGGPPGQVSTVRLKFDISRFTPIDHTKTAGSKTEQNDLELVNVGNGERSLNVNSR